MSYPQIELEEPHTEENDKGELLLTNRRVIFTGAMRTMEVRLSQLDALETAEDEKN